MYVEVGLALAGIRDGRLYRETHATFEAYCRERWGWARSYANKLIRSAEVVAAIPVGTTVPTTERQARELAPLLDDPDTLRDAWQETLENGPPTALKVREAVRRVLPPVSEEAREKQRRCSIASLNSDRSTVARNALA